MLRSVVFLLAAHAALSVRAPIHQVDLAVAPEHRYDKIVPPYMPKVRELISGFKMMVPSLVFDFITIVAGNLERWIEQPYADEIRGLSRASGIDVGDVVLLNLFYDLVAGCTSLVAYNPMNKSTTHGRNLDFNIPHLGPVTLEFEVVRNGTFLYRYTTFAGYVGILTGMKPTTKAAAGWTFSLDERNRIGLPVSIFENAIESMWEGGVAATLHARALMDRTGTANEVSFADALKDLSTTHLIAPSYLILSAEEDGAVVTRDRQSARDVWRLDTSASPPALVETNYDHWEPAPARDDRRKWAYQQLNTSSARAYGPTWLKENVMMYHPVRNHNTIYTTMMELKSGYYETMVWKTY